MADIYQREFVRHPAEAGDSEFEAQDYRAPAGSWASKDDSYLRSHSSAACN
jgi:hypothetical protein